MRLHKLYSVRKVSFSIRSSLHSDAASGWAGWTLAHPEFGSSVNPTTTRGADYAHHITASYGNTGCGVFKRVVQN